MKEELSIGTMRKGRPALMLEPKHNEADYTTLKSKVDFKCSISKYHISAMHIFKEF